MWLIETITHSTASFLGEPGTLRKIEVSALHRDVSAAVSDTRDTGEKESLDSPLEDKVTEVDPVCGKLEATTSAAVGALKEINLEIVDRLGCEVI